MLPPEIFTPYIEPDILSELSTAFRNISLSERETQRELTKQKCIDVITLNEVLKLNASFYAIVRRLIDNILEICLFEVRDNKIVVTGLTVKPFGYVFNVDYDMESQFIFIKFDIATVRRILIRIRNCPCKLTTKLAIDDVDSGVNELKDSGLLNLFTYHGADNLGVLDPDKHNYEFNVEEIKKRLVRMCI